MTDETFNYEDVTVYTLDEETEEAMLAAQN